MTIGFLGTGGIAEAIVRGLFDYGDYAEPVVVSRRNAARSERLARRYPTVEVEADGQAILDRCDWIVIGVRPEHARELLAGLAFTASHRVLSLVAGLSLSKLGDLVEPAARVRRLIPMPPIERGLGPIPLCPPDPEVEAWLARIGDPIPTEDESHFTAFSASTAIMASFFEIVASLARWIEARGVTPEHAAAYATSMVHALSASTTRLRPEALQALSDSCLTPGGLNEQLLLESREAGWFDALSRRLDRIHSRLTG